MSKELQNLIADLIESTKAEMEEIEENIDRLLYRAETTKDPKELQVIHKELVAFNSELNDSARELKKLMKDYKKAGKK